MKSTFTRFLSGVPVLCLLLPALCLFMSAHGQTGHLPRAAIENIRRGVGVPTAVNPATQACGTDMMADLFRKNPAYVAREKKMNLQILSAYGTLSDTIYTIPVVIHIIDPNPSSVTDLTAMGAIKNLNDIFRKTGPYAASTVDTRIQFCLAKKDPDGGNTTGITRTVSQLGTNLDPAIEDDKLKALSDWDPSRYCNIWIVTNVAVENFATFKCGVWSRLGEAGYATGPPANPANDGIVVAGLGTTGTGLAHEMGHYLSLLHTFQGLNCVNNNCATDGDLVCDTPPDASTGDSPSCSNPENSCSTDTLSGFTTDVPDLISNIMDYGNFGCHNEFTEGQAQRMRAALVTQRSGLLQDECDEPCPGNAAIALFARDNASPVTGATVNFTNQSTGAAHYSWLVNGVVKGSGVNFSYTFNTAGSFKVTLEAYNGDPACFAAYSDFVKVNCGVIARFYSYKRTIASKVPLYPDSISFTNSSLNATSYKWLLAFNGGAEQLVSTALNYQYTFPQPGNYSLRLIASNGGCSDTSEYFNVPVADPTQDGAVYFTDVNCYRQNQILVSLFFCNYGYAPVPANTPVSFYDGDPRLGNAHLLGPTFYLPDTIQGNCCSWSYSHVLNINTPGVKYLFAVFNDNGTTLPLVLPNTGMAETNYANNIWSDTSFRFKVTIAPPSATLQPGDTLQLIGQATPGAVSSYAWSDAPDLSCTGCPNPLYIAEKKIYTVRKELIATSAYGCVDSSFVVIKIPPYDDFTIRIDSLDCAGTDSLHVGFTVCNGFFRGSIPQGLSIAFYDADPRAASGPGTTPTNPGAIPANPGTPSTSPNAASANLLGPVFVTPAAIPALCYSYGQTIKRTTTGKVYAVVNTAGGAAPVQIPTPDSAYQESDYTNNTASAAYTAFAVIPQPPTATLEPGDTLQLSAQGSPGTVASYLWSTADNLDCTFCADPAFIAGKKNALKTVTATNLFGCTDTASVNILVPPADDYTVSIDSVLCYRNDSLLVGFTLCNHFKRGILPQGLKISFYDADPLATGAHVLGPVFVLPADDFVKCASFTTVVAGIPAGNLYAAVNNDGMAIPLQWPEDTLYLEKDYTNNTSFFSYQPDTVVLQPSDTTVLRKQSFPVTIITPVYDPSSTAWFPGSGYSLNCTACASPTVYVTDNSVLQMQTANRYGCLIKGKVQIRIFPPDMTLKILQTNCFTNDSLLVRFSLCMNNNYDSVFAGIPVSFYDGDPVSGQARSLPPLFYTPAATAGNCATYTANIAYPNGGGPNGYGGSAGSGGSNGSGGPDTARRLLYGIVNNKGQSGAALPDNQYPETDFSNNLDTLGVIPFSVSIYPSDTSIYRFTSVPLRPVIRGGDLTALVWDPLDALSCTSCLEPVVTPPYTMKYRLEVQNEYTCTATAFAAVRTITSGPVNIPNGFTPNGDGHNDIFYILGGSVIRQLKDFSIYNRVGELLFHVADVPANDPHFGWNGMFNGQPAAGGAYVYVVAVAFTDGTTKIYKGTVILVR